MKISITTFRQRIQLLVLCILGKIYKTVWHKERQRRQSTELSSEIVTLNPKPVMRTDWLTLLMLMVEYGKIYERLQYVRSNFHGTLIMLNDETLRNIKAEK